MTELADALGEVLIRDPEPGEDGSEAILLTINKLGLSYSKEMRDSGSYYDCSVLVFYSWRDQWVNLTYEGANTTAQEAKWCAYKGYTFSCDEMKSGDIEGLSRT